MRVSREFALLELKTLRDHLGSWIDLLETPVVVGRDGEDVSPFPDGVPEGLSVTDVPGIPIEQMKAELGSIASRLEVLVTT